MKPLKEKIPHLKRSVGWGGFMNSLNSFKLIIFMAIALGVFLLYMIYLILFTPSGIVGMHL